MNAAIAASGRHVVSAFVRPPTFGGASDLAHLGLLSGIDLMNPLAHDLTRAEPRATVYGIVGDHQPVSSVTGESSSWDVPVHIVSRDPALLQRFVALGFHPRLEPPRPAVGALHEFTRLMLCAFAIQPLEAGTYPAAKLAGHGRR